MASRAVMELDGKTIGTIVAALIAGGGSGFAAVEVRTEVQVARLEARLFALEGAFRDRVDEAAEDHRQTRQMVDTSFDAVSDRINTLVNALDARITRLDERKMDK